tara:strand:+ start:1275 stop:1766 length:492 start_codon:yes stop_codon:yes gene_type:complete
MALSKLDKTSEDHKMLETFDEEWAIVLRDLIDKVNTGFDKTNEHINKVASMQTEINTEKNKDGITTAQANAIVANTAKTGISTSQASAITANTAKTGITTAQSKLITALNEGVQQAVPTTTKGVTATIIPQVIVNKKGSTLDLSIRLSDGSIYATSLALTRLR